MRTEIANLETSAHLLDGRHRTRDRRADLRDPGFPRLGDRSAVGPPRPRDGRGPRTDQATRFHRRRVVVDSRTAPGAGLRPPPRSPPPRAATSGALERAGPVVRATVADAPWQSVPARAKSGRAGVATTAGPVRGPSRRPPPATRVVLDDPARGSWLCSPAQLPGDRGPGANPAGVADLARRRPPRAPPAPVDVESEKVARERRLAGPRPGPSPRPPPGSPSAPTSGFHHRADGRHRHPPRGRRALRRPARRCCKSVRPGPGRAWSAKPLTQRVVLAMIKRRAPAGGAPVRSIRPRAADRAGQTTKTRPADTVTVRRDLTRPVE